MAQIVLVDKETLIWGQVERPWGYEVRVNFTDEQGKIYNEVLNFKEKPKEEELADSVKQLKAQVEMRASWEEPIYEDPKEVEITDLKSQIVTLQAEVASLKTAGGKP